MTDIAEMAVLSCLVEEDAATARVRLSGRLDVDTIWRFGAQLAAVIRSGCRDVIVDAGDLAEISTMCVGVLNRATGQLRGIGGSLTLCGLRDGTLRRLQAAGLHPAVRAG